jgi:hypothetical protein
MDTPDGAGINAHNFTVPGETKIIIADALVFKQGGKIVVRLNAEYDFTEVPPEFHELALRMLFSQQRIRLIVPTEAAMAEEDRRMARYHQRKIEYEALPWWKKLFKSPPWAYGED